MNQQMEQHSIGIVINYNDLEQDMFKTEQNWSIWTPSSPHRFFHDIWHPPFFFFFKGDHVFSERHTNFTFFKCQQVLVEETAASIILIYDIYFKKNVIHVDLCRFVQDGEGGGASMMPLNSPVSILRLNFGLKLWR